MTLALDTTMNDLLVKLIDRMQIVIDNQREEIEILRNIQFRSGNKPTHYDIVITDVSAETFRVILNLRFAKDNEELQKANKELKARIEAMLKDGLDSRHFTIDKVEKTNAAKTKTWQEWQYVFRSCFASAVGQRIEGMIDGQKIVVRGLDNLASLARECSQLEVTAKADGGKGQDPLIQQIHILGNEWAKLCNPELGDWKSRHGAITRQYFNKDSTTELTPEQKEKYIRWLLRTMLREMGTQIWGSRFIGDLETQMIQVEYPDAENYQNLTTSQLRSLKTKWENQLGAKERRL